MKRLCSDTVFENHRKSLLNTASELPLHFLVDKSSVSIGKKLAHNAFNENFKFDILSDFQINILARKFTVVPSHAKLMPKLSSNRLFLSSQ